MGIQIEKNERRAGDWELLRRYQRGDAEAFEELVRDHQGGLIRFFQHHGCKTDVAEDLAQDVFLGLLKRVHTMRLSGCFAAYLFRAAYNRYVDYLRRKRNERKHRSAVTALGPVVDAQTARGSGDMPHVTLCARESAQALLNAVKTLPRHQRQALWMAFMEEEPYQEISRRLDVPVGTIKSRVFHAMRYLRRRASLLEHSA